MHEQPPRLSLEELQTTLEYQKLTQKQQLFVATYCAGGLLDGNYDHVAATRTAYECKSLEVARIMSYALMANIRIVAVLNRHFNATPIEEFIVMLDRAIRNRKLTTAQLLALKLKGDVMGFTSRLPGTANMPLGFIPPAIREDTLQRQKAKKQAAKDAKPKKVVEEESFF
jgi:hypothetical protein